MRTLPMTLRAYLFASLNLLLLGAASYFLLAAGVPLATALLLLLGGYSPAVLAEAYEAKDPKFALLLRLASLGFAISILLHGGIRALLS